jgi:nicotinamide-nucleotide amidase
MQINNAEILCVGTEILIGDIVNTNAAFISGRLALMGISQYYQAAVGDNPVRLENAIRGALTRCDLLIMSGGLGPTYDDLTKETAAKCMGRELYFHQRSYDRMKSYFDFRGRVMTENNVKQAYIPEGSVVFKNDWGTAPAVAVECGEKVAILLPGPPVELHPLWYERVEPYLAARSNSVILSKNLHILNMGESAVEEILRPMMQNDKNPTVAPYAKEGEVRVRVSARAATREEASALCDSAIERIRATDVGNFIYGIDVGTAENALLLSLRERGMTLAVAESCTGGLIAKRFTDIAGCSDVFLGGCVTYSNEAKMKLLGVKAETLAAHGAVSKETAAEMARGVRLALGADVGLATTGIAGPGGGTPEKPVGTVFVAISTAEGERVKRLSMSPLRSRAYIRQSSGTQAIGLGLGFLGNNTSEG